MIVVVWQDRVPYFLSTVMGSLNYSEELRIRGDGGDNSGRFSGFQLMWPLPGKRGTGHSGHNPLYLLQLPNGRSLATRSLLQESIQRSTCRTKDSRALDTFKILQDLGMEKLPNSHKARRGLDDIRSFMLRYPSGTIRRSRMRRTTVWVRDARMGVDLVGGD